MSRIRVCVQLLAGAGLVALGVSAPVAAAGEPLHLATQMNCPPLCLSILNMDAAIEPAWLIDEERRLGAPVEWLQVQVLVEAGEVEIEVGGTLLQEALQVDGEEGLLVYQVPVSTSDDLILSVSTIGERTPVVELTMEAIHAPR